MTVGTVELYLRNARRSGWGLALLGLVVAAVLAERLVIAVTPKVAASALSFRLLMPIVPLFALVAGGGIFGGSGRVLALLIPSICWRGRLSRWRVFGRDSGHLLALLRERPFESASAGRGGPWRRRPTTPQGLRVEALVEAQAEPVVEPRSMSDSILTGISEAPTCLVRRPGANGMGRT